MANQLWRAEFSDSILNSKKGITFLYARRGSNGKKLTGGEVPEAIRIYLGIEKAKNGKWYCKDFSSVEDMRTIVRSMNSATPSARVPGRITFVIDVPDKPKKRRIPKSVPAIRSLKDLCEHFGADDASGLNHQVYKGTECGASISVKTPDGKWHHNGQDWSGVTEIVGFTIQTIVEGSDAEVSSSEFVLPVTVAEVDAWVQDMEAAADRLWQEANGEEPIG